MNIEFIKDKMANYKGQTLSFRFNGSRNQIEEFEGIIVDTCSSYSFSESLKVALRLTNKEKIKMKKNARICAENNFDYRKYESMFDSLIKNNI